MTVSICWTAAHEDDTEFDNPFASKHETILRGEWADCSENGEAAVRDVMEDYFGEIEWNDQFADDWNSGAVVVEIHSPPSIAGRYAVDLEKIVRAHARKLEQANVMKGSEDPSKIRISGFSA